MRKFQCLSQEWNKKNHDLTACQEKLEKLTVIFFNLNIFKLDLTRFCYMPNRETFASKRELLIARELFLWIIFV